MNDSSEVFTNEVLFANVAAIQEQHNRIFQHHRQELEQLFREIAEIKQRLDKLESANSLGDADAKFINHINARLEAISTTLKAKV